MVTRRPAHSHESPKVRVDRELGELLEEIRVILPAIAGYERISVYTPPPNWPASPDLKLPYSAQNVVRRIYTALG